MKGPSKSKERPREGKEVPWEGGVTNVRKGRIKVRTKERTKGRKEWINRRVGNRPTNAEGRSTREGALSLV